MQVAKEIALENLFIYFFGRGGLYWGLETGGWDLEMGAILAIK